MWSYVESGYVFALLHCVGFLCSVSFGVVAYAFESLLLESLVSSRCLLKGHFLMVYVC